MTSIDKLLPFLLVPLACGGGRPASDPAVAATPVPAASTPAPAPATLLEPERAEDSADILARDPVTEMAEVRHVLIGWADLAAAYGGEMDDRAKERSRAEADEIAGRVLARARAGGDFKALMKALSEDWGSAETGQTYTATSDARLVPPFKALSLRLEVGEVGLVRSDYGWHVIKRVE